MSEFIIVTGFYTDKRIRMFAIFQNSKYSALLMSEASRVLFIRNSSVILAFIT